MVLAALLALGVDPEEVRKGVAALGIGAFVIETTTVSDGDIRGRRVRVQAREAEPPPHRHLDDIRGLIEQSSLPPAVASMSVRVFERLAEAEAKVHGTSPGEIHFHEVGALDSIVDIVGSCLALDMLGVTAVRVGPLPVGQGTIRCAHGVLPVPVPATAELLNDHPIVQTDEPFELVTPTGAALLTTWKELKPGPRADSTGAPLFSEAMTCSAGSGRIVKSGHGFGSRRLKARPNLLRAMLVEHEAPAPPHAGECLVLECNLDDSVPELIGSLCRGLLAGGALDVFTTPVQMKKQRPGVLLTVLCRQADRAALVDMVFKESTTFGIREHLVYRTILDRRQEKVKTPFGEVRVKIASWQGRDITRAPEHEDCVRCAKALGVPIREVYEAACRQT